jgi:16S rRNA (adenine(1408)-N(1))-methyltransferase
VLSRAQERPRELVIGVDAVAGAMAKSSRRAARRNALPNAVFVVSALEQLPAGLGADLVTIHFPWGSLLRGASGTDRSLAARIVALLRDGGTLRLLLSAAPCDDGDGLATIAPSAVARSYAELGLEAIRSRPATLDDARAARSSWGKRLLTGGGQRRAWLLELVRRQRGPVRRAAGRAP